jgi:hypothetical protein
MRKARPGLYRWCAKGRLAASRKFAIPSISRTPHSSSRQVVHIESLCGIVARVSSSLGDSKNQRYIPAFMKATVQKLEFTVKFIQIGVR